MNERTAIDEDAEHPSPTQIGRYGPVAVATVTLALATWPITFNLGAYDAVFYQDIFRFVVAATVGLAIAVIKPPYEGRTLWVTRAALATPAVWLALSVVLFDSTATAASDPLFGTLGLLVVVVSIPTVLKLLMDLFVPDLTTVRDNRTLGFAAAVVVLVAISGFAVGRNNDAFLTCDDFKIAGSDQPAGCSSG